MTVDIEFAIALLPDSLARATRDEGPRGDQLAGPVVATNFAAITATTSPPYGAA